MTHPVNDSAPSDFIRAIVRRRPVRDLGRGLTTTELGTPDHTRT